MKNISILLFVGLLALQSFGQQDSAAKNYINPEFAGGKNAYGEYLHKYMRYPSEAYQNNIEGMVDATLSIDSNGNIINVNTKGKNERFNNEVKRVFTLMPKWTSGKLNGNPIDTTVTRRIYFSLEKSRGQNDSTAYESYELVMYRVPFNREGKSIYDTGVTELKNGNNSGALDLFNESKQKGFDDIDLYYNRGIAQFKLGNKQAACEDWMEAARRGDKEALELYNKKCK